MLSRRRVAAARIPFVAVPAAAVSLSPLAAQEEEADLVARLTLDDYKATLKGLTQFGDRRQGTQRNRDAVDWIEAWPQDAGCTNTERVHYVYAPRRFADPPRRAPGQAAARRPRPRRQADDLTTATGGLVGRRGSGSGGSTIFGYRGRTASTAASWRGRTSASASSTARIRSTATASSSQTRATQPTTRPRSART